MRCVVLESQSVFAELLGSLLHSLGDLVVVSATHSIKEASEACRTHRPELLLFDSEVPGGNAFSVVRQLQLCSPDSRAIVLSDASQPVPIPPPLRAFVYSVIQRGDGLAILRGEIWRLRAAMGKSAVSSPQDPLRVLGPREREMFRLIGRGLPSKLIADEMHLSKASVDTYRKRIAAKLRSSGSDLVRLAALHGQMPLAA